MKTTLIAITLGLTLRTLVCGSMKPAQNRAENQVARVTSAGITTGHHYRIRPEE